MLRLHKFRCLVKLLQVIHPLNKNSKNATVSDGTVRWIYSIVSINAFWNRSIYDKRRSKKRRSRFKKDVTDVKNAMPSLAGKEAEYYIRKEINDLSEKVTKKG